MQDFVDDATENTTTDAPVEAMPAEAPEAEDAADLKALESL
jgi:hypothetical protein